MIILILKELEKLVKRESLGVPCSPQPLRAVCPGPSSCSGLKVSVNRLQGTGLYLAGATDSISDPSIHGGKLIPFSLRKGGSVQITLFLKIVLFALGRSQTSHVGGVCCVTDLSPGD